MGPGRIASIATMTALWLLSTGCAGLIFWPESEHVLTPADVGVSYENVFFEAADGTRLHGWYLPSERPRGTILHLHGNAENISTHYLNVEWLPQHGWEVFVFDYRGYGRSEGAPSLTGVHQDARAAYRHLRLDKGVPAERVVVFGQSLGASVAITAFAEVEPAPAAVVAEAAFVGYRTLAREKLASSWLTWPLQHPLSWSIPNDYRPIDHVADLHPVPVLLMHSHADAMIPVSHARRLHEAAREPKELWLVGGAAHGDILSDPEQRDRLLAWLEGTVGAESSK